MSLFETNVNDCVFLSRIPPVRPSARIPPPSEPKVAGRAAVASREKKEGDRPACPRNEIREEGLKRIGGDSLVSYSTLEADCDGGGGFFFGILV